MQFAEGERRYQTVVQDGVPARKTMETPITAQQWYALKVVVRGKSTKAYCDGELIFDIDQNPFDRGRVGVGVWDGGPGKLRVKDFLVKSPDGTVLWEGPPDLPAH